MNLSRAVLLLAAALFVFNVWGYDLWAPDEPYFGEGAREMVVDGEWAVPHVNGVMTTDKPPLFFWLIAIFSMPFGTVTSFTARLPSVLAGLACIALTIRLGRRLWGGRIGEVGGLILTVNFLFWDKARTAQIDALLCLLILVALSAFEAFRAGDLDGRRAGLLFWLAASLAVLAKGPVGVLLPLGVALITLAVDRRLGFWRGFAPLIGPLLFGVVIGLWMVLATVGGRGEYSVWAAIQEHVLDRAVRGMHHAQPPWYYLQALPMRLLPWSGLLPGALLLAWRRREDADRFLLVYALFVVVFFSISTEKRDLYVLPAFPAFALLMSRLVCVVCGLTGRPADHGSRGIHHRWLSLPLGVTGALLILIGAALPLVARRTDIIPSLIPLVLAVVLVVAGVVAAWAAMTGRSLASVGFVAAGMATAYLVIAGLLFPALDPVKSARDFSETIREVTQASRRAGHSVPAFRLSNLPEAFAFYSEGVYFPEIADPAELAAHLHSEDRVHAVVDADQLDLLPEAVRTNLTLIDRTRLSRRNVAIVTNGAEP
jgi:4-amino-4-deoxy-L-arabinose transferase-like glycosyltransferase